MSFKMIAQAVDKIIFTEDRLALYFISDRLFADPPFYKTTAGLASDDHFRRLLWILGAVKKIIEGSNAVGFRPNAHGTSVGDVLVLIFDIGLAV